MRRAFHGRETFHANDPYRDLSISLIMDSMRYVVKHAIPDEPVEHQARRVIKELLFLSHGIEGHLNPILYHELCDCIFLVGKSPYEILKCLLNADASHPNLLNLLGMDTRGERDAADSMHLELLTHNTQDSERNG